MNEPRFDNPENWISNFRSAFEKNDEKAIHAHMIELMVFEGEIIYFAAKNDGDLPKAVNIARAIIKEKFIKKFTDSKIIKFFISRGYLSIEEGLQMDDPGPSLLPKPIFDTNSWSKKWWNIYENLKESELDDWLQELVEYENVLIDYEQTEESAKIEVGKVFRGIRVQLEPQKISTFLDMFVQLSKSPPYFNIVYKTLKFFTSKGYLSVEEVLQRVHEGQAHQLKQKLLSDFQQSKKSIFKLSGPIFLSDKRIQEAFNKWVVLDKRTLAVLSGSTDKAQFEKLLESASEDSFYQAYALAKACKNNNFTKWIKNKLKQVDENKLRAARLKVAMIILAKPYIEIFHTVNIPDDTLDTLLAEGVDLKEKIDTIDDAMPLLGYAVVLFGWSPVEDSQRYKDYLTKCIQSILKKVSHIDEVTAKSGKPVIFYAASLNFLCLPLFKALLQNKVIKQHIKNGYDNTENMLFSKEQFENLSIEIAKSQFNAPEELIPFFRQRFQNFAYKNLTLLQHVIAGGRDELIEYVVSQTPELKDDTIQNVRAIVFAIVEKKFKTALLLLDRVTISEVSNITWLFSFLLINEKILENNDFEKLKERFFGKFKQNPFDVTPSLFYDPTSQTCVINEEVSQLDPLSYLVIVGLRDKEDTLKYIKLFLPCVKPFSKSNGSHWSSLILYALFNRKDEVLGLLLDHSFGKSRNQQKYFIQCLEALCKELKHNTHIDLSVLSNFISEKN